ncbi:phytase [Shewanella sp. 1CM18E]|uniref:phytase n=1 Tax=Shewanella sp. 1CM18E TaxID=2929169 RepID=UPI0020BFA4C7|nr:phytase [Shewanella sp. 1CM18E]MCK8045010.1 phytase [Shewanella sp. 1CM18E]
MTFKHICASSALGLSLLSSALITVQAQTAAVVQPSPAGGSEVAKWQGHWLYASEQQGLLLTDKGTLKTAVPGQFEYLAVHNNIALTYDTQVDQVQGIKLDINNMQRLPLLPKRSFQVEWLCLQPRLADGNLYAWIGDEAGRAEQWLLTSNEQWQPQLVRTMSVVMGALKCRVDSDEQLYVIDQGQGLWRYAAAPHSPDESELVTSLPGNELTGLAMVADQPVMLDESGQLYSAQGQDLASPFTQGLALESLYIAGNQTQAYSDEDGSFYLGQFDQTQLQGSHQAESPSKDIIKEIPTAVESAIADRAGDTMDDPAIWVHPTAPEKSLILGTNKRWGLLSFNMQGEQVQALGVGRVNNVDIRQGVNLGGKLRDIAVASNRDRNSLSLFELNAEGKLTQLAEQATPLTDIYGLCLYQPQADELYAFVNNKAGEVSQMALRWQGNQLTATEVRRLTVPSQPEGCVADDKQQRLFLGEENRGIWLFDLAGDTSASHPQINGEMIIQAGGPLVADIEGVALYQTDDQDYLVVSSQGNDSYLLYQSQAPYDYVGRFRIGVNAAKGFDGSAETDGLDVTTKAVGSGRWAQGMMVVQDGRNRMPDQNQNFKWVPWSEISQALELK